MKEADEVERLPSSVAGVLGFGLSGWAANAPLYLALALGVFVAYAVAEYAVPPAPLTTPQGQFKLYVLQYTGLFADALVVAAVALGVAARTVGAEVSARALLGGAVERWLPVIGVTFLAQSVISLTNGFSGLVTPPEPRALVYLTAPLTWLLWGILGLSAPFVALDPSRGGLSVVRGFGRAFELSLRPANLMRLGLLAAITMLPIVLETLLQNALIQQHAPRPIFWANVPIDALTIGPIAALQTAFALDFVRRAGRLELPPR